MRAAGSTMTRQLDVEITWIVDASWLEKTLVHTVLIDVLV